MSKLILTVGLPRSGKSTWAKKQGCPIVSSDALRLSIFGKLWWAPGEQQVLASARTMVRALFFAGHDTVIFDSMNLSPDARRFWLPTSDCPWTMNYRYMQTLEATCIQRARDCGREYLIPVIKEGSRVLADTSWVNFEDDSKDDWNETDFIRSKRHEG
jgi:predicted kinase